MDFYDKSKQPIRPLSRAVGASHVLAVISIAAAVLPIVVLWIIRPDLSFEAVAFTGSAIGWITALVGYALSSDFERALPLWAAAVNLISSGNALFIYYVICTHLTAFLTAVILDFILPIAAFFTIMIVKARLRAKNG